MSSFNRAQIAEEQSKIKFLSEELTLEHALFHLEDHTLLRGSLAAFELDASVFERRAQAFHDLFDDDNLLPVVSGAMLAAGDYSRRVNHRFSKTRVGSNMAQWRDDILTGSGRERLATVRDALGPPPDIAAERESDVRTALDSYTNAWLMDVESENKFDWRWYFVRYKIMRDGRSGIYAPRNEFAQLQRVHARQEKR